MNSKQAIDKIMRILNLTPQKFYDAKTEQGMAVQIEGDLALGAPIYVATEEGMIPAPDGVHKLDDGSEIEVTDGKVSKIKMGDMTPDEKKEDKTAEADIKDETMSTEEQFGDVKLKDGSMIRVGGEEPSVGLYVKKLEYDGTLSAVSDGVYETADGKSISVVGGAIEGIQSQKDTDAQAGKFTVAETADGVKVESPTFDVGEKVEVLGQDGEKSPAPDGEHQIVLKDESGNENKIRVVTKDGVITERENVEEAMSGEQIAEIFALALKKLEDKIDRIVVKQETLESSFNKFSKEPAGERVYTQKTITEKSNEPVSRVEQFKRLRETLSHN
jgi:hypothetical protein